MRKLPVFSRVHSVLSLDLLSCPLPVGYANSLNPLYNQRRNIRRSTAACPPISAIQITAHTVENLKKKSSLTQSDTSTTTLCSNECQVFWAARKSLLWYLSLSSKYTHRKKYSCVDKASAAPASTPQPAPATHRQLPRPLRQVWNNQRKCNYANLMYSSYMNASPTPAALTFCAK